MRGWRRFGSCDFRLRAPDAFGKQKENSRTEAQQHDGNAGGDSPKRSHRRATIVAATDDDVTRHGDKQFKNAAAQQPARAALHERVRIVVLGVTIEHHSPKAPKDDDHADGAEPESPTGRTVGGWLVRVLTDGIFEDCPIIKWINHPKAVVFERGAKKGKEPGEKQIGQKE